MKYIIFSTIFFVSVSAFSKEPESYSLREVAFATVISGVVGYGFGSGLVSKRLVAPLVIPLAILITGQGICGSEPLVCQCRQKAIVQVATAVLAVTLAIIVAVRSANVI